MKIILDIGMLGMVTLLWLIVIAIIWAGITEYKKREKPHQKLFACKHRFNNLWVEKDATIETIGKDSIKVICHLRCLKCHTLLNIEYLKLIGDVEKILARGENVK